MPMIDLALKDLLQVVRDRKSFLFLLLMPLAFTVFFGVIFSANSQENETDLRLPVGFYNQDESGRFGTYLETLLATSDAIRPVILTATEVARAGSSGHRTIWLQPKGAGRRGGAVTCGH